MIDELDSFRNCSKIYQTALRDNGSKPDVGSSNIIISGLPRTAIAMDTFRLLPPDNSLTFFLYSSCILSMFTID
jgi:hypothetical protein